ncbi:hypothetical protein BKA65DRAFT_550256 [Rhexocercosporidium sp. MPI-PUGE-AT-0058]|nr:hypothetical protein BKA65DRAFT_550256 [Rhexocercosporidium sp. MPI-PUGE-AT-0058]
MPGGDFEAILHSLYSGSVVQARPDATTVNLACLHRVALHRLQRDLVLEAMAFKYQVRREPQLNGSTIMQALKDHEYIRDCALKGAKNNPFIITTDASFGRVLLRQCLEKIDSDRGAPNTWSEDLTNHLSWVRAHPSPNRSTARTLFWRSRKFLNRTDAFKRFLSRFLMAFIGGALLVGPMHIMVLHPGTILSLIITSVSVLIFGILAAVVLEKMFDILSVTAAYAAVLVVFVGANTDA